jgi:hypothetical protein
VKREQFAGLFGAVLAPTSDTNRMVLLVYAALLGLGALAAASSAPASVVSALLGFTAFVWSMLFAGRCLALCVGLAAQRAPQGQAMIAAVLTGPWLIGLAAPAALGIALGQPPAGLLAAVGYGGLFGMLVMLLPYWCLSLAPLLWVGRKALPLDALPALPAALGIAALLLACGLLGWRALRRPDQPGGVWSRPLALFRAGESPWADVRDGSNPLANWLGSAGAVRVAATPQARMAQVLGAPFHRLDARRLLGLYVLPLLMAALLFPQAADSGTRLLALGAVVLLLLAFVPASRLFPLRGRPSAELAELALLPGLRGVRGLHATLRRTVLGTALRVTGPVLLLAAIAGLLRDAPLGSLLIFAVIAGSTLASGAATALWAAARGDGSSGFLTTVVLAALGFFLTMLLLVTLADRGSAFVLGWLPTQINLGMLAGLLPLFVGLAWGACRALRRPPHPFLAGAPMLAPRHTPRATNEALR